MRIAEDLLLLLTDDDSGRLAASAQHVDAQLAGANLLELTLAGRVHLTTEGDLGKAGRIVVRDSSRIGTRCSTMPSTFWSTTRARSLLR